MAKKFGKGKKSGLGKGSKVIKKSSSSKKKVSGGKKSRILIEKLDSGATEAEIFSAVGDKSAKKPGDDKEVKAFSTLKEDKVADEETEKKAGEFKKNVDKEADMLSTLLSI